MPKLNYYCERRSPKAEEGKLELDKATYLYPQTLQNSRL